MATISALRAQGKALIAQQKALVEDPRPWSEKRAQFDKTEADIKAVLNQLEMQRAVEETHGRLPFDMLGSEQPSIGDSTLLRSLKAAGTPLVRAPRIVLADNQARELHDAAISRKSMAIDVKVTDSTSAPMAAVPDYRMAPYAASREPTRVLDLLPVASTTAPSVVWYSVSTATSQATAVAEGGTKPTSTLAYASHTTNATKLAHVVEVTEEALMDFPQFLGFVEQDMTAGLINAENAELLNSAGTANDKWPGLLNQSGIQTRAKGAETQVDTLELAINDLRVGAAFLKADGIVMHPHDWSTVRTMKDSQGRYLVNPDPTVVSAYTLWGVPVAVTTQIAQGTALVGAFQQSVLAYVREGIRVETNAYGTTQFTNNTVLVRAEERLILTCPRPAGIVRVTGL